MYPLRVAGLPFVPIKDAATPGFEMPEILADRRTAQPSPQLRKVGRIIILPDDDTSPVYGEIPLFYRGDDPDLFLGKFLKTVGKAAKSVGGFAWRMSPVGQAVTWGRRGVDAVKAVARGERIDRVFRKLGQAGIADVRERLKIAEMVAPFIPGVGTGVAAALGAANALASGKPITEAVLSAARSAIPGGKIVQAGFDVAMNLARGKTLSESALSAVRSQLPGGRATQAAFDTGLALAQGKKLQHAAFAAAGRLLPPSRFAADARSFARAVAKGKNVQHAALSIAAQRALQGKKVYRKVSNTKRESTFEVTPDMRGDWRMAQTGPWIRNGRQIILSGV